jgi:hypothetical protein
MQARILSSNHTPDLAQVMIPSLSAGSTSSTRRMFRALQAHAAHAPELSS